MATVAATALGFNPTNITIINSKLKTFRTMETAYTLPRPVLKQMLMVCSQQNLKKQCLLTSTLYALRTNFSLSNCSNTHEKRFLGSLLKSGRTCLLKRKIDLRSYLKWTSSALEMKCKPTSVIVTSMVFLQNLLESPKDTIIRLVPVLASDLSSIRRNLLTSTHNKTTTVRILTASPALTSDKITVRMVSEAATATARTTAVALTVRVSTLLPMQTTTLLTVQGMRFLR